jgi:DegV family protein with EDD domain
MTVALVSDSCHYLPQSIIADLDLRQVPLYVHVAGVVRRETEIDYDAYYRGLDTSKRLPTTSQPSVGDFIAVYEPLLAAGNEIISIHLSGGISGTVRVAEQAREQLGAAGARIHVLDSTTVGAGFGVMLMAAQAALRAGEGVDGAIGRAQEARARLRLRIALDTLEYARRGGRIGAAQAWVGSTLRLKPILTMESVTTPVVRVRTSKRVTARLAEELQQCKRDGCDGWFVHHVQAPDKAEQLVLIGTEIFGSGPLLVTEVGPVIGTHSGPGTTAIGAVPKRLLTV